MILKDTKTYRKKIHDISTKNVLDRVDNVPIKLHLPCTHVGFVVMDM